MSSSCAPKLGQTVASFEKPKRSVNVVFLHCSAASNPSIDADTINDWHVNGNGWSCIGYHYFIKTDGTIQYGRNIESTPAAQSGYNTGSIAICLNGLEVSDFTEAQYDSVRWLCGQINASYSSMRFRGHKEVAAKACPVFDYRHVLGLDSNGYMTGEVNPERPPTSTIPMVKLTSWYAQLGLGDDHPHVQWVRGLLGQRYGSEMGNERIFTQWLHDQVVRFQVDRGLTGDGIVGKQTWQALLDVGH